MRLYFDTSTLVAAFVQGHPHSGPALQCLEDMVSRKHQGYTSAHSLAELYAVLTRAPFQPRITPAVAWHLLEENVLPVLELVTLTATEYQEVIRSCVAGQHTGGRTYDAIHLHCALKVDCDKLYTLNVKDFRALAPDTFQARIVTP